MKSFYEIQTKKLKIEEINTHVRSKEVDNKQTELKLALLTEETKIMTTPMTNDMYLIETKLYYFHLCVSCLVLLYYLVVPLNLVPFSLN
jgi:hypothetical protein